MSQPEDLNELFDITIARLDDDLREVAQKARATNDKATLCEIMMSLAEEQAKRCTGS